MYIKKLECADVEDATECARMLNDTGVKAKHVESAVVLLGTMSNRNTVMGIAYTFHAHTVPASVWDREYLLGR